MSDPWRHACPEGHRAVVKRVVGMNAREDPNDWYCNSCPQGYSNAEIRDLKAEHEA